MAGWIVTHVNGRISSPLGRSRTRPAPSIEAAPLQLAAIAKRRRQRGALDFGATTPGRNIHYFPRIFEPPAVRC